MYLLLFCMFFHTLKSSGLAFLPQLVFSALATIIPQNIEWATRIHGSLLWGHGSQFKSYNSLSTPVMYCIYKLTFTHIIIIAVINCMTNCFFVADYCLLIKQSFQLTSQHILI